MADVRAQEAQLQAGREAEEQEHGKHQIKQIAAHHSQLAEASPAAGSGPDPVRDFEFPEVSKLRANRHDEPLLDGETREAQRNRLRNKWEREVWKHERAEENSPKGVLVGVVSQFPAFALMELAQHPDQIPYAMASALRSMGPMTPELGAEIERLAAGEGTGYEYGQKASPLVQGAMGLTVAKVVGPSPSLPEGASSNILVREPTTLQKMHDKHGADFGVVGKYQPKNKADLSRAVHEHINSPDVLVLRGAKFHGKDATFYLNPATSLNVVADPSGNLLGGWRLNPVQQNNVIFRRKL